MVANKGFKEAKYIYGMILLSTTNFSLQEEGLKHMRDLRVEDCAMKC